jgi:hypothetical protein
VVLDFGMLPGVTNNYVKYQYCHDCNCVKMFDTPMSGKGLLTNINLFVVSLYILIYFR